MLQYIGLFVENAGKEDSELIAHLIHQGVAERIAERLVAFLPLAFGRVVIENTARVTFSDKFEVYATGEEKTLSQEPVYSEAFRLARDIYRSGQIPREQFLAVANRSAELGAVTKALSDGADINGASLNAVVLWGFRTL